MKKIVILFTIISIFLTGCSLDDIYQPLKENINEKENDKFTLSDDRGYADSYGFSYYIEGVVKNNTNYNYSYVQVQFNVYDSAGNVIGSCFDNINNLEANGTWKIKTLCTGEAKEIKSYKLTGFTSW